jgi:ATPase subunit of ABC transporter with duplicated ATPase domains
MNVLSLESVSKTLKDEPLFEGVSFGLEEGDHVASSAATDKENPPFSSSWLVV